MKKYEFTEAEKKDFLKVYLVYRETGAGICESYQAACREYGSDGRKTPSFTVFRNWYESKTGDIPEQETEPTYTDLLEALLKLYRYRREEDVDAVYDNLIPAISRLKKS